MLMHTLMMMMYTYTIWCIVYTIKQWSGLYQVHKKIFDEKIDEVQLHEEVKPIDLDDLVNSVGKQTNQSCGRWQVADDMTNCKLGLASFS